MKSDMVLRDVINWVIQRRWWARDGEDIIGPAVPFVGLEHAGWHVGPSPEPWREAVGQLVRASRIKEIAERLPEGRQRNELTKAAMTSIDDAIDTLCPPPRKIPWPRSSWGYEVVSELARVAGAFAAGAVRDDILNAAAQIAARSFEANETP